MKRKIANLENNRASYPWVDICSGVIKYFDRSIFFASVFFFTANLFLVRLFSPASSMNDFPVYPMGRSINQIKIEEVLTTVMKVECRNGSRYIEIEIDTTT